MADVCGVTGQAVLARIAEWRDGSVPERRKWVEDHVKPSAARSLSGKLVTVVRASAFDELCRACGAGLPVVTGESGWTVDVRWRG